MKEKAARGERLEVTQLTKIESEAEIRKELGMLSLSWVNLLDAHLPFVVIFVLFLWTFAGGIFGTRLQAQ